MTKKTAHIRFRTTPAIKKAGNKTAAASGIKLSALLEKLLTDHIKRKELPDAG